MNKYEATEEIKSISDLANNTFKKIKNSNTWYQGVYINQTLSSLKMLRGKVDGLIKGLLEEFSKKK